MKQNSEISQRIAELVDYFAEGVNTKFAELVGTNEANIRNYKNGKMPKLDFIQNVCSVFEVNYEWLIAGKGDMLKSKNEISLDKKGEIFYGDMEDYSTVSEKDLTKITVESNSKLVDANVKLANANLILAETNARLSQEILNARDPGKDSALTAGFV